MVVECILTSAVQCVCIFSPFNSQSALNAKEFFRMCPCCQAIVNAYPSSQMYTSNAKWLKKNESHASHIPAAVITFSCKYFSLFLPPWNDGVNTSNILSTAKKSRHTLFYLTKILNYSAYICICKRVLLWAIHKYAKLKFEY